MQFPITIGLHRSRFLEATFIVVVVLAVATTIAAPLDQLIKAITLPAIMIALFFSRKKLRPPLSAIRLERDGSVGILPVGADEFLAARVAPNATVHPWLVAVRLVTEEQGEYNVIAVPGSAARQDLRRLRVFLRWRAQISADSGDAA